MLRQVVQGDCMQIVVIAFAVVQVACNASRNSIGRLLDEWYVTRNIHGICEILINLQTGNTKSFNVIWKKKKLR